MGKMIIARRFRAFSLCILLLMARAEASETSCILHLLPAESKAKLSAGLTKEFSTARLGSEKILVVFEIASPSDEEISGFDENSPDAKLKIPGGPIIQWSPYEQALRKRIRNFLDSLSRFESQGLTYVGPLWSPEWPMHAVAIELPRSLLPVVIADPLVTHAWAGDPLIEIGDPEVGSREHFDKAFMIYYRQWMADNPWQSYSIAPGEKLILRVRNQKEAAVFPTSFEGYPVELIILDSKN